MLVLLPLRTAGVNGLFVGGRKQKNLPYLLSLNCLLPSRSGSRNRDRRRWVWSAPKCLFVFLCSYWGLVNGVGAVPQSSRCAPWKKWELLLGPFCSTVQLSCKAGVGWPSQRKGAVLCTTSLRMLSMSLPINVLHALIVLKYEMYLLI